MSNEMKPMVASWITLAAFAVIATVWLQNNESAWDDGSRTLRMLFESGANEGDLQSKQVYGNPHAPLFPLTASDYVGFSCAVAGLMLAAGGGIGGGGILVPIYILIMGFSPKNAIPLSNVTVLGGSIANTVLNAYKRHPLADRPLVDWDLILVMEPLTIGGALIGALLNKLLPEVLLVVMLVVLLSCSAYKSLSKGVKLYRIETQNIREQNILADDAKESLLARVDTHFRDEDEENEAEDALRAGEVDEDEDEEEGAKDPTMEPKDFEHLAFRDELQQILDEEREVPTMTILILTTMFMVVLVTNVLKGGGAFKSPIGIVCGSVKFWTANGLMIGWVIMIMLMVRAYLVRRCARKQRVGYQYVEGDIKWDGRATLVYPSICCLAGFFAGMFGIGGGIVKGPLMLAMGVHPAVSSATSACMILFTSLTATTSFLVFGLLDPSYGIVCVVIGFAATYVGQVGLAYLMRSNNRNSYIIFSIGGVVLLSAILMTAQSVMSIAAGSHPPGRICGSGI